MDEVKFSELQEALAGARIDQPASEIHGLVTGLICAGSRWGPDDRRAALGEYLGAEIGKALQGLLERMCVDITAGLRDEALAFRLMLPDDGVTNNELAGAVSHWCSGFLAGFGMTGRYRDEELSADLREVFGDLARISALTEEVPDDDDNEADLTEIIEYVRMSALMVYIDCGHESVH